MFALPRGPWVRATKPSGAENAAFTPCEATCQRLPRDTEGLSGTDLETFGKASVLGIVLGIPDVGCLGSLGLGAEVSIQSWWDQSEHAAREVGGARVTHCVCFPPRGFFGFLLRKRCSGESESEVNLRRTECRGQRKEGRCRLNISLSALQREGFFWRRRPLWLQDMYRPLNATRKKNMAQKLHDKESSDEEEVLHAGAG